MSHFGVCSALCGCVFFLHARTLLRDQPRWFPCSTFSSRGIQPLYVVLSTRMGINVKSRQVQTGRRNEAGCQDKTKCRFLVLPPLNPLFSCAHLWLSLVCTVGEIVFVKIKHTRWILWRAGTMPPPNQPDPLFGSCTDYAPECQDWRSHLSTERIAKTALRVKCVYPYSHRRIYALGESELSGPHRLSPLRYTH